MSEFLSNLDVEIVNDGIYRLQKPLVYMSDRLESRIPKGIVIVPAGFYTDFASVPRVPIAYMMWGDRAHREAVIHDFLYRIDCTVQVSCSEANSIFLEAMKAAGKPCRIYWPMYWGVCLGGWVSWHKRSVSDVLS